MFQLPSIAQYIQYSRLFMREAISTKNIAENKLIYIENTHEEPKKKLLIFRFISFLLNFGRMQYKRCIC